MEVRHEVVTRLGPLPVRSIGEGPAVLFVHGLLLDGRLWDGVADDLIDDLDGERAGKLPDGVRLLLPDLPLGAHRRPVPDRSQLTPATIADALIDVLDGLGLETAVLVGNDTGGALAQIAAAAHPHRVEGLVLTGCDAFEHFPPPLIRPLVTLFRLPGGTRLALRAFGLPGVLADGGRLNLFSTRGLGRPLVRDLLHPATRDSAVRADLTTFVRSIRPEPLLAAVDGLRAHAGRAAVVWGRHDRVFPARDADRLAALLGTTVRWADDASTFVPVDRPDAVAEGVRSVLATVRASTA